MQSSDNKNNNKQSTVSVRPSLPPLYFHQSECESSTASASASTSTFPLLCSELETNIYSYLNWGDYARLAPVHSRLEHIVNDAAQQSNDAKWSLALHLLNGTDGLEMNPALAMKYLEELSNAQDKVTTAMDNFSPDYNDIDNGNDYESASNNQCEYSTAAMRQLALCYLEGKGVEHNTNMGLAWLQQAYKNGDIDAAYETATIFEHGKYDVNVDIYIAARWFLGAAKLGHVESMAEYAMCLELGCGVDQCDTQALDWYTKAANKGHVTANFSVGEMFESARGGVPQSDTEAVLWYYKAAMLGDEDSKLALQRLNDIARIVVPGWAAALNVQSAGNAQ